MLKLLYYTQKRHLAYICLIINKSDSTKKIHVKRIGVIFLVSLSNYPLLNAVRQLKLTLK